MFDNLKKVNRTEQVKAKGSRDWVKDETYYGYLTEGRVPEGATGILFTMQLVKADSKTKKPVLTGQYIEFWETVVLNNKPKDPENEKSRNGALYNIPFGTLIKVVCTGSYKAKSSGKLTSTFEVDVVCDEKDKPYVLKASSLKAVSGGHGDVDLFLEGLDEI